MKTETHAKIPTGVPMLMPHATHLHPASRQSTRKVSDERERKRAGEALRPARNRRKKGGRGESVRSCYVVATAPLQRLLHQDGICVCFFFFSLPPGNETIESQQQQQKAVKHVENTKPGSRKHTPQLLGEKRNTRNQGKRFEQ